MEPDADEVPDRDHHLLRDADDPDDWAWRAAIRRRPTALLVYRMAVFSVGLVLVLGGLVLVPLPGPGWLIVILGLAIWASEFEPAQHLLAFVRARLREWDGWVRSQHRIVQGLLALLTGAFVLAVVWVTLYISGVPGWLPDWAANPLVDFAHLPRRSR